MFQIFRHKPGTQKSLGPAVAGVPGPISIYVPHMIFYVPCYYLPLQAMCFCLYQHRRISVVKENDNYELR
jgi:hypothetical protein